jgi:hypothetical protein
MFETLENQWRDALARWDSAVYDFEAALEQLRANYPKAKAAGDLDAWNTQYDRAIVMKQAIADIQSNLGGAVQWFKNVFGLNGMQGMGAIPLIPIAVITGSISGLVAMTYAIHSYNAELERKWEYIAERGDIAPGELVDILNSGGGIVPDVKNVAAFIVIAGLALYFGPRLLKGGK